MNTKLLNELELHLHNSELALQLARKAVAELKAETPVTVDLDELRYKYGLLEYLRNSILAEAIQKLSIQYFQETHPNHSLAKGLCPQIEPDPADYLGGFLETEPTGVLDSILDKEPEPIDFYAKLEGEHYSHKPCSTDTREPKTELHARMLEKGITFNRIIQSLYLDCCYRNNEPDPEPYLEAKENIFEREYKNSEMWKKISRFIENYKPHGEV